MIKSTSPPEAQDCALSVHSDPPIPDGIHDALCWMYFVQRYTAASTADQIPLISQELLCNIPKALYRMISKTVLENSFSKPSYWISSLQYRTRRLVSVAMLYRLMATEAYLSEYLHMKIIYV